MGFLNDIWSGLDAWDKEENARQKTARTQRSQVKAAPVQTIRSKPGFSLTNNSLTRGVSRAIDQVNPLDNGRTWKQRTPVNTRSSIDQLTHNGATNMVGNSVVKPLVRTSMAYSQAFGNLGTMAAGGKAQNAEEFYGKRLTQPTGYTGTKRQITGDLITNVSNLAMPGSSTVAKNAFRSVAPKVVPDVAKRVVANAGVGAIGGAVGNTGAYIADETQPLTKTGLIDAAKTGATFGAAMGGIGTAALPVVKAGARASVPAAKSTTRLVSNAAKPQPVRQIDATIQQYQKAFDVETNPTRRRQISQGIARLNAERRQMMEGGYVKNPLSGDGTQVGKIPALRQAQEKISSKGGFANIDNTPLPEQKFNKVSALDKAARSTRSIIERSGAKGKELADMLQGSRDTKELMLADIEKRVPTLMKLAKSKAIGKNSWTNKDFENFVDATQGLAKPKNSNIAKAVEEWQAIHPEIRNRAVSAGLDVGDLGPNYYPHFIDYDALFKDTNTYNKALNHLVKTGQAKTQEEAMKLLTYARDVSRNRQFGNLEASRIVDLPYYDKTPESLRMYLSGSSERIANTETFGKADEKALKLIKEAGMQGYDTEAIKNAYDVAVGAKQYNPTTSKASRNVRKYVTTTRLGLGALTNVSQSVNTGVVTGHLRTMKSMFKQLDPKTQQFVKDTGVIADAVLNDIRTQSGVSNFTSKVFGKAINKITAPGFSQVEKFNRSVAATAGRDYALRLAQKGDESTLRKLGVKGDITNKTLTEQQQIQAARKIVEKTQFKVDPQDLPGWADSPGGKMVAQFRTFSYNQSKFFSNEILKPLAKGNVMPASRMLAALPLGYALFEARRMIDGRPPEEDEKKVAAGAFSKIGGAGLVMDIYTGLNPVGSQYIPSDRRQSMAVGTFLGPSAGIATQGVGALSEAVQRKNTPDNPEKLEGKVAVAVGDKYTDLTAATRFGLQQVPIVGTPIKNRVLPFKKESDAQTGTFSTIPSIPATGSASAATIEKPTSTDTKAQVRAAFSDTPERIQFAKMSETKRKEAADNNSQYKEWLDEIKSIERTFKPDVEIPDGLPGESAKILTAHARRSEAQRERLLNSQNDYEYKLKKAQYDREKLNGTLTRVDRMKKDDEIKKLKVGSNYSRDVRQFYGLNKSDIYDYITNNEDGGNLAKQLLAYDDALVKAGVISKSKFRDKYGNVKFDTSKSSGSGSKRGSSRKFEFFAYGNPATSVNKSLRALLDDAMKA